VALVAGSTVAVGAVVVVMVMIDSRRLSDPASPRWRPSGIEFPLHDNGQIEGELVPALSRSIEVPEHPPLTFFRRLSYDGGLSSTVQWCSEGGGGGGCAPDGDRITASVTSSVDNGVAEFDLFIVERLPEGTAVVAFSDGVDRWWQRPVFGVAAFPYVWGRKEQLTAYDADGVALLTFSWETRPDGAFFDTRLVDISAADLQVIEQFNAGRLEACLAGQGVVLDDDETGVEAGAGNDVDAGAGGGVAADEVAAWDMCVTDTQAEVAALVQTFEARIFDPARGGRPNNPDTPWQFAN
jgi:hypothetical protein